jgi:hypothetical protein
MTKPRLDGLILLALGGITFLVVGATIAANSAIEMIDFRVLYYPARCLLHHGDPYNADQLLQMTMAETGDGSVAEAKAREVMRFIYFPTAFSFTLPFALLSWGPAHILWMALIIASIIFASYLIWRLAADYDPVMSGALIGLFLFNSELLVVAGNMAGVAISLCAIAVWCFVRERFVTAGILCLAVALIVKPHDSGLVWLYFLLAGGMFRKWALRSLLATFLLGLPGLLWTWIVAPHWITGLRANLVADAVRGGTNDPGLTSTGAHGLGMMVNLQTFFSPFWAEPRFYNSATWVVFGVLLLIWAVATIRVRASTPEVWLALAVVAPLTMMPFYHRQQDTRLLLLAIPACAMLWAKRGAVGRSALFITFAAVLLIGDIPWIILLNLIGRLQLPANWLTEHILIAVQIFPVPLILLATCIFYLWIYVRHYSTGRLETQVSQDLDRHSSTGSAMAREPSRLEHGNTDRTG